MRAFFNTYWDLLAGVVAGSLFTTPAVSPHSHSTGHCCASESYSAQPQSLSILDLGLFQHSTVKDDPWIAVCSVCKTFR